MRIQKKICGVDGQGGVAESYFSHQRRMDLPGEATGPEESNCFSMEVRTSFFAAFVCLFDLILYVPSTTFQLCRDGSF